VKPDDLRELSIDELRAKANELRREHFGAKVRHATGQLENTAKLSLLRRDIARIETLLREKGGATA